MDLIASIKYIENRLGGYNSNQGKNKLVPKIIRSHSAYIKHAQADTEEFTSEDETRLGRNIDIKA